MFKYCFKINNLIEQLDSPKMVFSGEYKITVRYNICNPFGYLIYRKEIVIYKNNTVAFYIQIDRDGYYFSGYNPEMQSSDILTDVVAILQEKVNERTNC